MGTQTQKEKEKRQIILSCEKLETRFALLNNQRLEEYNIERPGDETSVGSVYIGKIVNLEPSLQAAFVDLGTGKNAFLHYWDMIPASQEKLDKMANIPVNKAEKKKSTGISEKLRQLLSRKNHKQPTIMEREQKRRRQKIDIKDIPELFPEGTELLVQVTKGPIGTKGPRVTTNISIAGRFLVMMPYSEHIGLSSKIDNSQERNRLRKILSELDVPDGMGLICRTVGEGRKSVFFKRDMDMLLDYWHHIEESMENPVVPSAVYSEPNLLERTIRDFMTEDIDEIIVDDSKSYRQIYQALNKFGGKKLSNRVYQYNRAQPIFEYYKIKSQVNAIFNREVQMPSGGYICIDETEALIAIDVNSGKNRSAKDQPETIIATNLEAAEEVARQLRLRNIGGLVVIDFIDMRYAKDRDAVFKLMRKLVKSDRAKTRLLPISRLGLMEMTRQREYESLKDTVYASCPYCSGTGKVKSSMSMSVEIQRRLNEIMKRNQSKDISFRIFMHPTVLARMKNADARLMGELEDKYGKNLSFRADTTMHRENFKIVDPDTGVEFTPYSSDNSKKRYSRQR
ncbi:MAG: Rne/Rng family ribonuclease [Victivallaceae bacterium]|nr:Rne/Rng family ribonuclease [Victivallaceae bacterium]